MSKAELKVQREEGVSYINIKCPNCNELNMELGDREELAGEVLRCSECKELYIYRPEAIE